MGRYREWPRREWPAFVAIVVLILGNVWLYGVRGADWHPISPPFILAVAIFIGGEFFRKLVTDGDSEG